MTLGDRKAPRVSDDSRAHIVADAGGNMMLCRRRRRQLGPDDTITMAWWVQQHVDADDPEWCRGCAAVYVRHPQSYWPVPATITEMLAKGSPDA